MGASEETGTVRHCGIFKMAYEALNSPELVALRQAWEQRIADPEDTPVYLRGVTCSGTTNMYADPEKRMQEALEMLAEQADRLNDVHVFRPLSVNAGLHGVHFIDKIFGADVYELNGKEDNRQVQHLATPVGKLARPDLENNPAWIAAKAFAKAFVDSGVTAPVFMLPTIASALNIGLILNRPDLPFIACTIGSFMADQPRFTHSKEINAILLRLPSRRRHTACVDDRDITGRNDRRHYDTESQLEIGRRFALAYLGLNHT
jgi:hypothetical protein